MKSLLTLMILVAAMVAAPVMAEGGNVSDSTLASLGLGSMELLSDADGMSVRGMSSSGGTVSTSFASFLLFDPDTGSAFEGQSSEGAAASSTEAGAANASQGNAATNARHSFGAISAASINAIQITTPTSNFTVSFATAVAALPNTTVFGSNGTGNYFAQ